MERRRRTKSENRGVWRVTGVQRQRMKEIACHRRAKGKNEDFLRCRRASPRQFGTVYLCFENFSFNVKFKSHGSREPQ